MSYIGQNLPTDVFGGYTTDTFAGDGSATTFTLSQAPFNEQGLIVVINNVIQQPTTNYTVSGTTLTIVGTAVASGDVIYARHTGVALPIGEANALDLQGQSDKLILDADADTTISADTDDQIDFKAGGTDVMSMTATGLTINDGVEIIVNDNSNTLKLTSTDADATNGPILRMFRDSSSPADSDETGRIIFSADNDAGEETNFFEMKSSIGDASDGTEDGRLTYNCMVAGTARNILDITSGNIVFNQDAQDIDFRVESNANSNCFKIDAAALSGQGAVGIGDINTSRVFNITTPSSYSQFGMSLIQASSSAPYGIYINYSNNAPDASSDYNFLDFGDSTTDRFRVASDGDVKNHDNSYGALSDERIKQDITDANSQWDDIKALKVRNFKMKDDIRQYGADKSSLRIGLIAQEVESVSPNLVDEAKPSPSNVKFCSCRCHVCATYI